MINYLKIFICGITISLIFPSIALAGGWPTLYGSKATLTQGGNSSYSTEGFGTDSLENSRTKVLVSADDSRNPDPDRCLDPYFIISSENIYDCLLNVTDPTKNYYAIQSQAHPDTKVYSGKLKVNDENVDSETVLVYASKQLIGDIYSSSASSNTFKDFTSYGEHLGLNNDLVNTTWKLNGYKIDPASLLYWDTTNYLKNIQMQRNLARLKTFSENITSFPSTTINDSAYPEGKIWWYEGDMNISEAVQFSGKGTIIINGSLNITGSGQINNTAGSKLGLIVMNQMSVTGTSQLIMNAVIFCKNSVTINRPINFTGSIVASKIKINNGSSKSAFIKYDPNLGSSPPPGINFFAGLEVNESF